MKELKPKGKRIVHVSEFKKNEVNLLRNLFAEYGTIILVDLTDLPSSQLQAIRQKLRNKDAKIRVTKKRLIKKTLDGFKAREGMDKFVPYLDSIMPALIFSKQNIFKVSQFLRKNKSKVAAKKGQIAPRDLIVNAGPTPFTPGPMIGELGSLGIKSSVDKGKIVIKDDVVVVKEGKEISGKVADLLVKLGIKPMEIGLNLVAAYENGSVLDKEVLDFDDQTYIDEIKRIASDALKLTISIGYATNENVKMLLVKAEAEAKAVANVTGMITNENVGDLLAEANQRAEIVEKLASD